eukprot:TRINITY_DN985_c0_g1_i1.p2 TRINITY_DN985_c0_g1~~TRINITY_DN985_c0_g1_i1.p2  ORF type:complete len:431 (-),score=129.31 TRINITY_DN985_c0_g1_i1:69-1361(-)
MFHQHDAKLEKTTTTTTTNTAVPAGTVMAPVVEQRAHAAAVHEVVKPTQIEEVQPVIQREINRTEVHQITQPIYEQAVLPTQVQDVMRPTQVRQDVVRGNQYVAPMHEQSSRVVQQVQRETIMKPAIIEEVVRPRIIEEIQPVIYRENIQPTIIRETQPIQEHIIEQPVIYRETRAAVMGGQPMAYAQHQEVHTYPQQHIIEEDYYGPAYSTGPAYTSGPGYTNAIVPVGPAQGYKRHHPHMFGRKHHDAGGHAGMLGSGPRGGLGLPSHRNVSGLGYADEYGYGPAAYPAGYAGGHIPQGLGYGYHDDASIYGASDVTHHSYRWAHRDRHLTQNPVYGGAPPRHAAHASGMGMGMGNTYSDEYCALHSHAAGCPAGYGQQMSSPYTTTAYSALAPSVPASASYGAAPQHHRGFFGRRHHQDTMPAGYYH